MKPTPETVLLGITRSLEARQEQVPGSFIQFKRIQAVETGVTQFWAIESGTTGNGTVLGSIKWFGRWRKYGFFPEPNMVFEEICMREIAHFGEQLTRLHREARKKQKEVA